jgi:hypothetical protein
MGHLSLRSDKYKKPRFDHGLFIAETKKPRGPEEVPTAFIFSIRALQRWTNPSLKLFHHQFLMLLSLLVIFFPPILFSKVIFSYQTLNNVSNGIFKKITGNCRKRLGVLLASRIALQRRPCKRRAALRTHTAILIPLRR